MDMPKRKNPIEQAADTFKDLTNEEKHTLQLIEAGMRAVWPDSPQAERMIKFSVEHQRLAFLVAHAAEELKQKDPNTYHRFATVVRADWMTFTRAIDKAEDTDFTSQVPEEKYLDSNDVKFSGIMTNDGFRMRAQLIEWLRKKKDAQKLVKLLRELQKLLPEPKEGDLW